MFPREIQWDAPLQVVLKFVNPLEDKIVVSIATTMSAKERTESNDFLDGNCEVPHSFSFTAISQMINYGRLHQVTLLAPTFTVDPVKEIWEYEEPDTNEQPATPAVGIYDKRKNITSIMVQVTPRRRHAPPVGQESRAEVIEVSNIRSFASILVLTWSVSSFRC